MARPIVVEKRSTWPYPGNEKNTSARTKQIAAPQRSG